MMGKNLRVVGQVSVMKAEAFGVQKALEWIQELHLQQVEIECDSSLVIDALLMCSKMSFSN